jgi:hypothetical protein
MSHLTEYKGNAASPDGRNLGDEWLDWDGSGGGTLHAGKWLFLGYATAVVVLIDAALFVAVYLVAPRLYLWSPYLPPFAWVTVAVFAAVTAMWFVQLALTAHLEQNCFLFKNGAYRVFDLVFTKVFRLAEIMRISRDRMGNSFVKVSNAVARALKVRGREERVLVLLPRCLKPEQIKEINAFKEEYGVYVHTVAGGELARKKVKELKPTAVVGIACERDLVSGIRDVGTKLSVIGIPNERPDGPCRNTYVDMALVRRAIEFYVGRGKGPADAMR